MSVTLAPTRGPTYPREVIKFCYEHATFCCTNFRICYYTVLIIIRKPTGQCYLDHSPGYCLQFVKTIKTYFYWHQSFYYAILRILLLYHFSGILKKQKMNSSQKSARKTQRWHPHFSTDSLHFTTLCLQLLLYGFFGIPKKHKN